MRAPVTWLRELVQIPVDQSGRDIAARLIAAGLEVERVETIGGGVDGSLVIGCVLEIEELTAFKKPIRWCQVDVGAAGGGVRGIICGARNFAVGDIVVVALPGTVLPGGFMIASRETYGHISDGMICSERELDLSEEHDGIMVLASGTPGTDAKLVLGLGEEVLDVAVTPDRGYALSMRGLARELAISYGVDFADPGTAVVDLPAPVFPMTPDHHGFGPAACASADFDSCAMFTLRTIVGFDPKAPTPMWMKQRLTACGMRPVSLAVDVTNYVMLELGQPLHAFDLDKLHGTIRADWAPAGSNFETLDHVVRELGPEDLVIADDRGIIGLAGTMGGLESEIDDSTTSIALEAAIFSSAVVARMSRRHKVSSEASRRFERGVDRVLAPYASARGAALLLEYGGGQYVGMTAVEAAFEPTVIAMNVDEPGAVAGMTIAGETVVNLLQAVGCEVARTDNSMSVTMPSWRPDLTDPADLVEEVIRLVGYDHLPSTMPRTPPGRGLTIGQRHRRLIGSVLAARGMVEVLTYPFVGDDDLDALAIPMDHPDRATIALANPLSDEQPYLRANLLPGLISTARRNIGRGNEPLAIFEMGMVFRPAAVAGQPVVRPRVDVRPNDEQWGALNAMLPVQPRMLGAVFAGERRLPSWWGAGEAGDWSDATETASVIARLLGVNLTITRGEHRTFHPGRCAQLSIDGLAIGVAGEIHPRVLQGWGMPDRASAFEIDIDALIAGSPEARMARVISSHPVAKEDLAVVVASDVTAADVTEALRVGAGELLESIRLFDVYSGPQIPEGYLSLAFALRFRAPDRTLTAEEIASARSGALSRAQQVCGATLRGA